MGATVVVKDQHQVPILRRVVKEGNSRAAKSHRTAAELDFLVDRIVEKHTVAMRRELKTVLGIFIDVPQG